LRYLSAQFHYAGDAIQQMRADYIQLFYYFQHDTHDLRRRLKSIRLVSSLRIDIRNKLSGFRPHYIIIAASFYLHQFSPFLDFIRVISFISLTRHKSLERDTIKFLTLVDDEMEAK
jgi:hypothetical protein